MTTARDHTPPPEPVGQLAAPVPRRAHHSPTLYRGRRVAAPATQHPEPTSRPEKPPRSAVFPGRVYFLSPAWRRPETAKEIAAKIIATRLPLMVFVATYMILWTVLGPDTTAELVPATPPTPSEFGESQLLDTPPPTPAPAPGEMEPAPPGQ